MTDTKFTKGKWIAYFPPEVLNCGHVSVENDDGVLICMSEVYKLNLTERTANVNLISSAHDMYLLLNEMITDDNCQIFKDRIKKVLDKAVGNEENYAAD